MAITRGNTTGIRGGTGTGTSITWAFNSGSPGSNSYLVVGIFTFGQSTDTLTACTYAGTSMTKLATYGGTIQGCALVYYGVANPTSGSNNVVITSSGSLSNPDIIGHVFEDCSATQPNASATNTEGSSSGAFSTSPTSTVADTWGLLLTADGNGGITGSTVTSIDGWTNDSGVQAWSSEATLGTAGVEALTVTGANGGGRQGLAILLAPFVASARQNNLLTLGVG